MKFGAVVEGWALYAERLAWDIGFHDYDLIGELGRLRAEAFRAARLAVDTGIHSKGWTRDQAIEYMESNTGLPRSIVAGQIDRYVVYHGQATAYSMGMLKILGLRKMAEEQLDAQFDSVAFNDLILSQGSMPLDVLEHVVDRWIAEHKND